MLNYFIHSFIVNIRRISLEYRQLAKMDIQTVFFVGEFPHEFRQLASFTTNFAIGETTVGEKEDWRRYIDSL